jgi:hypothetical protein
VPRPSRTNRAARRLRIAAAVLTLSLFVGAGSAAAQSAASPAGGSGRGSSKGGGALGRLNQQIRHCKQQTNSQHPLGGAACDAAGAAKALTDPAVTAPIAGAQAQQLGAHGQVDPISGLGIRNPACDRPDQITDPATRTACRQSGAPEGLYPASNYGFDVFIDTGIDAPTGTFIKGFVMILNGIWLGLIFVLKLVLALLGLAFGLNPFGDGPTMDRIAASVERIYQQITDPWLSTLVVAGGVWLAFKGLVRRELAAGVAGTLAAVALLIAGLWVVHQPRQTVGQAAEMSNQLALGVISVPEEGSLSRPVGSWAEAMSRTWSRLVEVPFAGLDFSDVKFAMSPPPPEAVRRAGQAYCQDVGVPPLLGEVAAANGACERLARQRFGRPRRVIDLYLRSSPGSPSRQALWQYFDHDAASQYKAKVAAQGGDGVLTRLAMLALFGVGLLGALLLLAWLAIRLFMQAAVAFVLTLAAPLALFLPLLGDSGRRSFRGWGLTLLGAITAKVIYAALLSIVLLGISILGQIGDGGGSATGFLLSAAFTWALFLKRSELLAWVRVGHPGGGGGRELGLGAGAAFSLGRGMVRSGAGAFRRGGSTGVTKARTRLADGAEATRGIASSSLGERTRALAEQRHREARETVLASPGKPGADAARYRAAQGLLARAAENERTLGRRFSHSDLERYGREDRALLERSRDPREHAHRAGYTRTQFDRLEGTERKRVEREIERATERDRRRLGIVTGASGAIREGPRLVAERLRQGREETAAERRAELERLRRHRRHRRNRPAPHRRNLSRGV